MAVRIREWTTGVASLALLLPGCKRTSADISASPDVDVEPVASDPGPGECPPCAAAKPAPAPGSSGDVEPPVILGARFVTRDRVQISFSEGLGPVDQVNPRQFRLSLAYSNIDYDAGYATGYYYDLAGSDNYEPPVVVIALDSYAERPEMLALALSRPVPTEMCADIEDMDADGGVGDAEGKIRTRIGLFLHYTSRGSVGVRDQAQNPLGDVGGEWALHFGARHRTVYGTEPVMRLDLLVELPCPDESLGISAPPGPS